MVEQNRKDDSDRERNDRILAVPAISPRWEDRQDLMEVSARVRDELAAFFLQATLFENKHASVLGFAGASEARRVIAESVREPT